MTMNLLSHPRAFGIFLGCSLFLFGQPLAAQEVPAEQLFGAGAVLGGGSIGTGMGLMAGGDEQLGAASIAAGGAMLLASTIVGLILGLGEDEVAIYTRDRSATE